MFDLYEVHQISMEGLFKGDFGLSIGKEEVSFLILSLARAEGKDGKMGGLWMFVCVWRWSTFRVVERMAGTQDGFEVQARLVCCF